MKAFVVKLEDGSILDTVIRAVDEADARSLVAEEVHYAVGEIRSDVAQAIGAPEGRGRHDGVVTRWMLGPTTIWGDLISR